MCVLCGEFVAQPHWTERHVEDRARNAGARSGTDCFDYQRERRRDRVRRASLANQVLCHYGLKVRDWDGSKYLLSDGKGRSEVVQDLGSLWPVATKLAGSAPDPLDPALHAALQEAQDDVRRKV